MAKVVNTRNNGNPGIRTGEIMVNSKNVYPEELTATASGSDELTLSLLDGYDFFTCTQTSAATDTLVLPVNAPVGTQIVIQAIDTFGVISSDDDTINNVGTIVTLAPGGTATITKCTSTAWKLLHQAANGAVTAPVV